MKSKKSMASRKIKGGSMKRTPSKNTNPDFFDDNNLDDEATCTQQLSSALGQMGLGNLLTQDLSPDMAADFESHLIQHFETGAKPEDFIMNMDEFNSASSKIASLDIPKQPQPETFVLNPTNQEGEEGMDMQRRCSKRCLWLYGFLVHPIPQEPDEDKDENEDNEKIKNKPKTESSNQHQVIPITLGKYAQNSSQGMISRNKTGRGNMNAEKCSCETTTAFQNVLRKFFIGDLNTFENLKQTSSNNAMEYLKKVIKQAKVGLSLLEHENFTELIIFEMLKYVRKDRSAQEIMSEIRSGVSRSNQDYRKLMTQRSSSKSGSKSMKLFSRGKNVSRRSAPSSRRISKSGSNKSNKA